MSYFDGLSRRELLRDIMVLVGASVVAGCDLNAVPNVESNSANSLDESDKITLSALSDTIVPATDTPGALAARVPENFNNLMVNWASPEIKDQILSALDNLNQASIKATTKFFSDLSTEDRTTFLIEYDKAALQSVSDSSAPPEKFYISSGNAVVDPSYLRLKELIIKLYYISEIALTQELVYEHVPGKWAPSIKYTPDTRPFASP